MKELHKQLSDPVKCAEMEKAGWNLNDLRIGCQIAEPVLNKTEAGYRAYLSVLGVTGIMEQAITLRLNPPFKNYRPDLAYLDTHGRLVLVEVKAPHRFKEKGIAKAALAAKTYPQFKFELALWQNKTWKVSVLSP